MTKYKTTLLSEDYNHYIDLLISGEIGAEQSLERDMGIQEEQDDTKIKH